MVRPMLPWLKLALLVAALRLKFGLRRHSKENENPADYLGKNKHIDSLTFYSQWPSYVVKGSL